MSTLKQYSDVNVLDAAKDRVSKTFDDFERIYVSFSGGKDSSVMMHLVLDEAKRRGRTVGVLIIDLEAQYSHTINHIHEVIEEYKDHIDLHWVCLPMSLRNAVSNFEPRWCCWDADVKDDWVRPMPDVEGVVSDLEYYPFFQKKMEFEEFMVLFGEWYAEDQPCAAFIGIRADESLNRFRTIASKTKEMWKDRQYTTRVNAEGDLYNIYPLYDWKTQDIWRYHAKYKDKSHNHIYDLMNQAGLSIHQARLCQPYGDDQRRGLWLFHILEPQTWFKVVSRVNGVNSGALYIEETGNITGYNKITRPPGHTWQSYCNLLLKTLPKASRDHYIPKFRSWMENWKGRGYYNGIPDAAPSVLENKQWAPSWRRLCKVLLRNDYWCKGLGLTQPKSDSYARYMEIKKERKAKELAEV